jgi:hypothetical protein
MSSNCIWKDCLVVASGRRSALKTATLADAPQIIMSCAFAKHCMKAEDALRASPTDAQYFGALYVVPSVL